MSPTSFHPLHQHPIPLRLPPHILHTSRLPRRILNPRKPPLLHRPAQIPKPAAHSPLLALQSVIPLIPTLVPPTPGYHVTVDMRNGLPGLAAILDRDVEASVFGDASCDCC